MHNNFDLLNNNICVQTCVFPVRYEDFDNGCVEDVIKKYFADVDIIMTTSRNNDKWDVEQYAIEYRGGFHDNMNVGNTSSMYNSSRFKVNTSSHKTKTTLPKDKIFGKGNDRVNILGETIVFDNSFTLREGSGNYYLSNEIMYRATKVRDSDPTQKILQLPQRKPIGYFHIKDLEDIIKMGTVKNVIIEIKKKQYHDKP